MKIVSEYVPQIRRDFCWYDSSNVLYSECVDNENDFKTLYVLFKNGIVYRYDDVNVNDYVMLKNDSSQGSRLNTSFKKYKCERVCKLENFEELLSQKDKRTSSKLSFYVDDKTNMVCVTDCLGSMVCQYPSEQQEMAKTILDKLNICYTSQTLIQHERRIF